MKQFEEEIKIKVSQALQTLYSLSVQPSDIILGETKKEFVGDVTLVVFPFTKSSKKSPEETAKEIGEELLKSTTIVSSINVVKGFLNLVVSEDFWKNFFTAASTSHDSFFASTKNSSAKLLVEYSSPNTNKPLHLGHIRNNLLGYSVAEILKATGNTVMKVNIVNDRGIHICKSMLAWMKYGHGETPNTAKMKGDHLVGKYYVEFDFQYKQEVEQLVSKGMSREDAEKKAPLMTEIQDMLRKWEAGDKETLDLWNIMNAWVYKGFDETYKMLGVDFDKIYYESQTYLIGKIIVEEGLNKNIFFKKDDGSVWVDLTDVGLDQKLLLRGDGTSVYMTQDLGTAQLRFDDYKGSKKLIYVVGNEQEYHFKVLKEIFKKLGTPWADGLYHLSYGMVDLPSGKMKSREGSVVDADDLIKEMTDEAELTTKALGKLDDFDSAEAKHLYHTIGMGALKYFILKVDPKKRMLFNPAESIDFNGNTGPFIQYTYARIRSVIKKGSLQLAVGSWQEASSKWQVANTFTKEERNLIAHIYQYPNVIKEAAASLSPALIANYVYELAKTFNHFYHDHVIVDEQEKETTAFRLQLSDLTSQVIAQSMKLLGIGVPERM